MTLLSALSSTTSPLAMPAMPLVGPPAGDFAALIAGMVPTGDAEAMPVAGERQGTAPTGNALPVTLATPTTPVAPVETPAPVAPPLPVSATEAVLMLPQNAAAPVATPIEQIAPVLVAAAAIGVLADALPDKETVETPPRAEEVVARALPMPVPTRFAMTPPRAKRAETATPDTAGPASQEDGTDPEQPAAEAAVPVVAAPVIVPPPADAILLPAAVQATVQAGDPATASGDGATPAAMMVIEMGEVVAAEPVSGKAPTMRSAKRADAALPPADTRRAAAATIDRTAGKNQDAIVAEPAIGVVTPLNTDQPVPVHVVVPPVVDGAPLVVPMVAAPIRSAGSIVRPPATAAASPVVPPQTSATPMPGRAAIAPSFVRSIGSDAVRTAGIAPVAAVAPDGLAGAMVDLLPVDEAPLAMTAPATPAMPSVAPAMPADAAATPVTIDVGQPARTPTADAVLRPAETPTMPSPTRLSRPMTRTGFAPTAPVSRGIAPNADAVVERGTATPIPVADSGNPVPLAEVLVDRQPIDREAATEIAARPSNLRPPAAANTDRQPIASDATAPAVSVAAAATQPTVAAPPVTRIAGVPVPDTAPVPDATLDDGQGGPPAARRPVDAQVDVPAAMPPVSRSDAVPVAGVAPIVADAMLRDSDTQVPRARRDDDPAIPTTDAIAAPDAAVLRPVAPTAHAANPALDTRQPQWIEGMIDRIETLREASGTNGSGETRIRLSPDALGDVEVAIRTGDDGKLHVHFNSDNADAGRLLADAQPRLLQMAEARGLKLGGMQVDVGTQQQSQQSQRQAQDQGNPAPRAPRSAARADTQTTRSDDRIA
ncbi:flagellar hook-length control protein FliK [uncultured Sphingomonas sp.]|uniref:flagellar hook-length control protein FliK n=1 Tax=uncultured Sphingomonas sp. TaxID=158754 RepID=UPI0025875999|nr:flagellar hook-length control protein FliK [uncultured Sphingomonas sp.]